MNDRPNLSCRELIDFIADYLDGSLPPQVRSDFERHLGVCPSCVSYLDGYRKSMMLGKAALRDYDDARLESAPESLVRAVLAARRQSDKA
ncbi:hypothetical protein PHYC_01376 [Phycisphaerales bacterium]|nr:hypothetical protein PHYC_01376 [Phycisphaerales bacterium]